MNAKMKEQQREWMRKTAHSQNREAVRRNIPIRIQNRSAAAGNAAMPRKARRGC